MLLSGILIYAGLFVVLMVILMKSAPVGYENESGFHYGSELKGELESKKAA
jgi:hypothetical protein